MQPRITNCLTSCQKTVSTQSNKQIIISYKDDTLNICIWVAATVVCFQVCFALDLNVVPCELGLYYLVPGNLYLLGFELSFAEISCSDQPKKWSNESCESKSQQKELLAEQINEILHKVNEGCKFTAVRNLQCDMQKPLAGKSFLHDFIKFFTLELSTLGRLKKNVRALN